MKFKVFKKTTLADVTYKEFFYINPNGMLWMENNDDYVIEADPDHYTVRFELDYRVCGNCKYFEIDFDTCESICFREKKFECPEVFPGGKPCEHWQFCGAKK